MKRLLCTLFVIGFLTLSVSAKNVAFESDYVKEDEFVLASFNGTKPFFADQANPAPIEDACYWLADYASSFNLKYVSFIGNMSSCANYTYNNYVSAGKLTISELYDANETDEEWQKDFVALKTTAELLKYVNIPYGVSIGLYDYFAYGFSRRNLVTKVFSFDDYFKGTDVKTERYDINNYASIFEIGTQKYIVYQLEAFPRKRVIDWFNATQAKHKNKRAIVFTTSFLDANGEMYTQHDWSVYTTSSQWLQVYGKYNTHLKTNMLWEDSPRDGDQLWKDAFASWDNLLLIVSANANVGKNIVTKQLKNNNGRDVLAVVANLYGGHAHDDLACPLLFKISADNKTVDIRYAVPFFNVKGGYVEETKTVVTLDNISDLCSVGDINKDGEIDLKDVTHLRRGLAGGYGVEFDEKYADVNSDGEVDLKDVTTLRRYLAGGYGVTLD